MPVRVETLDRSREAAYGRFLEDDWRPLLYASPKYLELLARFLDADVRCWVALDDAGRIVGALPAVLKRHDPGGAVLNSLPFYGSNGGVVEHAGDRAVRGALLDAFDRAAETEGCVSSTLITSPFETDLALYEERFAGALRDERIGQITSLAPGGGFDPEALLASFDPVRRRNIRKAERSGFTVRSAGASGLDFLVETHEENMRAIGGAAKPRSFFDLVASTFEAGREYDVVTARDGAEPVAALLLFYFNRTVEYFTPVIRNADRTRQPLSLVCHHAMCEAARRGFEWWNWGGTWKTQTGVHRFKKKWAARDLPYYYYTRIGDPGLLEQTPGDLLLRYPYFFVVPFSALR